MTDALAIFWSPVRYIRGRCKKDIKLAPPFVIFVGALVLFIVDMSIMYSKIMGRLPQDVQEGSGVANLGFGIQLMAFGVNMFMFWVIGAGIMTCVSILLDGEGEYRRALELTRLAHLPLLVFALMGLMMAVTYKPQANFDRLFEKDVSKLTTAEQKDFEDGVRKEVGKEIRSPTFQILTAMRYTFQLWTLVLCVIAVRFAFNLDYVKSGFSVVGLVVLYVVLEIVRNRLMQV